MNDGLLRLAACYGRSAARSPDAIRHQAVLARETARGEGYTIPDDPAYHFFDDGVGFRRGAAWDRMVETIAGRAQAPFERVYISDRSRISRQSPEDIMDAEALLGRYGIAVRYCVGPSSSGEGGAADAQSGRDLLRTLAEFARRTPSLPR